MSCFVFVVLAEGLGFLSFFGGLFWLSVVFSRASGVSCVSRCSAPACWGGGRVAGGSGVRGSVRPGGLLPFCWGVGWGVRLRAPECLASSLLGGRVRVARVARFPWWGSGCARFPVRVRGVVVVFAGGFRVLFFPSGASRVLLVSGVGLRGLAGGWGVVGGVGLGWGCFFSGFCCTGPGLFGFGLGFVWRV